MAAIITVRQFPPRESLSSRVNLLSRYGTWPLLCAHKHSSVYICWCASNNFLQLKLNFSTSISLTNSTQYTSLITLCIVFLTNCISMCIKQHTPPVHFQFNYSQKNSSVKIFSWSTKMICYFELTTALLLPVWVQLVSFPVSPWVPPCVTEIWKH